VLPDRIELSASPLPRECSTTELRQHLVRGLVSLRGDGGSFAIAPYSTQGQKQLINAPDDSIRRRTMGKSEQAASREQRLAAKLRENLKRRKDQAKARAQGRDTDPEPDAAETGTDKEP
jgi:hypothetical protein